jgi:predicted phage tail protein
VINNSKGIAGLAQVKIMALKVLGRNGTGDWSWLASAIKYAYENGAHILSMSLGASWAPNSVRDQAQNAWDNGSLLFAASGNDGTEGIDYPAYYDTVIAVGATNSTDVRAGFSQYGNRLELVAPGVSIYSCRRTSPFYQYMGGTSQATPHASGVAALMWSRYPSYSNMEARLILRNTSVDLGDAGWDKYYGYGRVNAYEALLPQNNDDQAQEITTMGDDKYSFDVNTDNFGIVAIKAVTYQPTYPYYLDLYDTPTYITSLAQTTSYPDDDVAFIAIDGHELPSNQTYYYRVQHQASGYKYILETENGSVSAMPILTQSSPTTSVMNSTEIIDAFQIQLQTGVTYDIEMSVTSSADFDLYIACGDIVTDEDAARSITRSGTATERLVFAVKSNRWCIVVVTNPFGDVSEYTITVDTLPEDEGVSTNLYYGSNAASFAEFAMEVNQDHISVAAIRSITHQGSDPWYLMVYDNPNYVSPLAYGEAYPDDDVSFIVIDGHLLGSNTTYYPQVSHSTQGHSFALEIENGSLGGVVDISISVPTAGGFSSNEVLDAYQISLEADRVYDASLTVPAGYDFDLYVICQDLESDNYSFGSRSPVAGAHERVIFSTNRTGYCALVVTNPLGDADNYVLNVDYYEEDDGALAYLLRGWTTATSREFAMDVDTSHYAVIGAKSVSHSGSNGYALDLYDNQNYISSLSHTESYPDDDFSFIAVDGNRLPMLTTYYPKIDNLEPGYAYQLEIENGSLSGMNDLVFGVPFSSSFTSNDLLDAYQISLQTGFTYDVTLDVPGGEIFDLYVACGSIVTDDDSVASNSSFAGFDERLIFATTESAHCLILAVNKFYGSGPYTITVNILPEDEGARTHLMYGPSTASSEELAMEVIPDHYGLVALKSVSHFATFPYDLNLYDNPNYVASLASTQSYPDDDVAFLTIDGHGLPSNTTFYPKVTHSAYGYTFNLEMENGTTTGIKDIDIGTSLAGDFTLTEIVDGYQVNLTVGVSYNITLNVPAGFDYDLYLLNGQYRSEEDFDASSVTRLAGADEYVVFVPALNGSHLLVVTNPLSGSSSYTLAVSTADLSVVDADIAFSSPNPTEGELIQVGATIRNLGSLNITSANLRFYDNDPAYNDQIGPIQPISNLVVGNFIYVEVDWDTTNLAGNHTIHAVLSDIDPPDSYNGNDIATKSIEILPTPQNERPTISILSPTAGEEVAGEVVVQGVADDNESTLQYVEVKIDTGAWTKANGTTSWNYSWNTTFFTNGPHLIFARSFDGLVFSEVASVGVIVNNTGGEVNFPPEAVVLSPPTDVTDHSMKLSWSQNNDSDFVIYDLHQSETSGILGMRIARITDRLTTWQFAAGLNESTTYYFTVRVIDIGGLFNDSNQVNGTTLPENVPPSPVTLDPPTDITPTSMTLTWSQSMATDFARYEIYQSQVFGSLGTRIRILSSQVSTYYVATGLNSSTTYYFTVRVIDTGGLFADSNQESGTTLPPNADPTAVFLMAPTNITSSSMTLSWTENMDSDFARYETYQSIIMGSLGTRINISGEQSQTSYEVRGLSGSMTYYFTVRVVDSGGLYADSNQVSGTTLPPNVPPVPVNLNLPTNITESSLVLSWSQNGDSDFARYDIYQSTAATDIGSMIGAVPTRSQTTYGVTGLNPQTTYFFTIRVVDTGSLFADSNQVSATTTAENTPPTPVVLSTSDNTDTSIRTQWTRNSDADFALYEVFVSLTMGPIGTLVTSIPDRDTLSYIVTGLLPETTYYFTVRVVDNLGLYSDSNQVSATTLAANSPPQAVVLNNPTDITPNSMTLNWSESIDTDFALYEVYVSTISGQLGSLDVTISSISTTSASVSGLSSSTTYYFTVRVVDTGLLYADSNQVSDTTLPPNQPPSPVILSSPTNITNNSLCLQWTENTDGDFATYEILMSTTAGGPTSQVAILTARDKTSHIVTGLYPSTDYYFRVRVTDTGGLFSDSNQVTGRTLQNDDPPTPVLLYDPYNIADYSLTLRWTMNSDSDFARYDIYRSEDALELGIRVVSITSRSVTAYVMVDVQPETTYYFVVRVIDAGIQASDSNQVSATTLEASGSVEGDSDGDGLPDSWEEEYFDDLAEGPLGDPDGDGRPNIEEYGEGTDPTVPDQAREPGFLEEFLWIILLMLALIFLLGMAFALAGKKKLRRQILREKAARRALVIKHKRELRRLQPVYGQEAEPEVPPPPSESAHSVADQEGGKASPESPGPGKKVTPRKKVKPRPKQRKVKTTPRRKAPPPPGD